MKVAELIVELQKLPHDLPVQIVYDSAVCRADIVLVSQWYPEAYWDEDNKGGPRCVGLFEKTSADDVNEPDDYR